MAFRVLEFLCANPDESLSAADVAVKFDCTRNNVHTLLAPAVSAGSLIRRRTSKTASWCIASAAARQLSA